MIKVTRCPDNPILTPDENEEWQATATYNGSATQKNGKYFLVFRALSSLQRYFEKDIELSSIGICESTDGVHFTNVKQLITPEYEWEEFSCEDPRVTELDGKYYIFYTAVSGYPPSAENIKTGVAITRDFSQVEAKYPVTTFNSKGVALFPQKIGGKMAAILTVNTDRPPSKIAVAYFDKEEEIWSKDYWNEWINDLGKHVIPIEKDDGDQAEVGAPPVLTKSGWLLIYSYIKNYFTPRPIFSIQAMLLDKDDPTKIIGATSEPLLIPWQEYELYGKVPNIVFPSGAIVNGDTLSIYYGAADTTCCLAQVSLKELLSEMTLEKKVSFSVDVKSSEPIKLERFDGNPIISPVPEHPWESKYTFNPGAIFEEGRVHILYRAMGDDETSVFGYAASSDGFHIDERLAEPIYTPREDFEKKAATGFSGCEDPRLTKIEDKIYMCYTAFTGTSPERVTLTSIPVSDFLAKRWNWAKPLIISSPSRSDKNAGIILEKINGRYPIFHRVGGCIWLDYIEDLTFQKKRYLGGKIIICPLPDKWNSNRVGITGPPIKTEAGWLLIFHGLSREDSKYRIGAMLLDLGKPEKIIAMLPYPILEPEKDYEDNGFRPGTVFPCGVVKIEDKLFVYYGAADQFVGVARCKLSQLLTELKKHKT